MGLLIAPGRDRILLVRSFGRMLAVAVAVCLGMLAGRLPELLAGQRAGDRRSSWWRSLFMAFLRRVHLTRRATGFRLGQTCPSRAGLAAP